jgi:hypothetical protein
MERTFYTVPCIWIYCLKISPVKLLEKSAQISFAIGPTGMECAEVVLCAKNSYRFLLTIPGSYFPVRLETLLLVFELFAKC